MELRAGYKQTEVGVIPEDWEIETIKTICSEPMQNGVFYTPSSKERGIKLINVGDLYKSTPIDIESLELFNARVDEKRRFRVINGDIFFTRSSIVPDGIAHCNIYQNDKDDVVVFDSHVIRVRPNKNKIYPLYFYKYCLSKIARSYLVAHSKTATMTTIDQGALGKCPVLVPPYKEQTAIANALSDADVLIQSLIRLIAKKHQIKQGAMQTLLNPYENGRLKEGWAVKKLRDIGSTFGGLSGKTKSDFGVGEARYIPFMNVMNDVIIDIGFLELVRVANGESQNKTKKGDLFFNGSSETPDELGLCSVLNDSIENLFLNSFCFGFRLFDENDVSGIYLAYFFRSIYGRELFHSLAQGATRYNLSKTNFLKIQLALPKFNKQTNIVAVLTDMDAEIEALETKLTKYQKIKQGMMQNLLTGRIRLI